MSKKPLHMISVLLLVVGGLNWGLVGLLNFDLVATLLGGIPLAQRVVYMAIGLAAIVTLLSHKDSCKMCGKEN